MPPITGDELVHAQLANAESGQISTSSYPYKLFRALNSTKSTGKAYLDSNEGGNVLFDGGGWGNTGPVIYETAPTPQGLGAGGIVGIVFGALLVAGAAIAVIKYRKKHGLHGDGGPGLIEKWRAKLLGAKGHGEEKAGSELGTVAPASDHYAHRSRSRGRSTYG